MARLSGTQSVELRQNQRNVLNKDDGDVQFFRREHLFLERVIPYPAPLAGRAHPVTSNSSIRVRNLSPRRV